MRQQTATNRPHTTTTSPVHTPPQEMGEQADLQAQLLRQGINVANQTRPASQVYDLARARQQASQQGLRLIHYMSSQEGGGTRVVGTQGVGGGGGQQTAMYPSPDPLPVPPGAVYMQGQAPSHPSRDRRRQQSDDTMNSQTQPIKFSFPPQRHQGQHNQSFYPSYQPTIVAPHIYEFVPAPTTQHAGFYYAPQGPGINLSRAAAGAVTGGAQTDVYQGHNGGGQNPANNSARNGKQRRTKAFMDIIDPRTGKNISEEIYDDDAATQSGGSSNRATPQPQNCGMETIADFAARVAKAATEGSDSGSPTPSSAPDTPPPTPGPTLNPPPFCSASSSAPDTPAPNRVQLVLPEQCSGKVSLKDEEKNENTPTGPPSLQYTDSADQQGLLDVSGRIVYDREFLIALRTEPSSKMKPNILPHKCANVLKDNCRIQSTGDRRPPKNAFVFSGNSYIVPEMVKSVGSRAQVAPKQGNPKLTAQNVIKVSLSSRENADRELREKENAGNSSGTVKPEDANEEKIETESLYVTFRTILDTLATETFETSRNQIWKLKIDSMEKFQYLFDLVCEKAIDNPDYYEVYALTCKELARVHLNGSDTEGGKKKVIKVNFRKLTLIRKLELMNNTVDDDARAVERKEIEDCPDTDKKKQLLHILNERAKKIPVKSVGNIRFVGELFRLGMLTIDNMHKCISHLLTQIDDESLEHLIKLLTVIGKELESKGQSLDGYFEQMLEYVNRKGPVVARSEARYSLLHLINLRSRNWVPIVDDCNPKTLDRTATKSIIKSPDVKLSNTPTNTARDDEQNKNNEGDQNDEGSSKTEKKVNSRAPQIEPQEDIPTKTEEEKHRYRRVVGRLTEECESKSPNASELEDESPNTDDLQRGNKNTLKSSGTVSVDAPKLVTPKESAELKNPPSKQAESAAVSPSGSFNVHLAHRTAMIIEEYLSCTGDTSIRNTAQTILETYDDVTFVNFVRDVLNSAIQKSAIARKRVGQLMSHLISVDILPLPLYLVGLTEVLDNAEDLVIYIPKIWVYLAELIWYPLAKGVHPFGGLKTIMGSLKSKESAGELMVELTIRLVEEKTPEWIKDKWDQSGLQVDQFESDFLVVVSCCTSSSSMESRLSMEDIREQLIRLMSRESQESLTDITKWISVHVGERVIESEFVKVLMTAILETSIEPYNGRWQFRVDKFRNFRALIPRYIDISIKLLELQFLISIQEYKDQLEHPQSAHLQTIEKQTIESIVSFDVFDLLEDNTDRRPVNRKLLAILALKSFFTALKVTRD